jgi:hypothetical protein
MNKTAYIIRSVSALIFLISVNAFAQFAGTPSDALAMKGKAKADNTPVQNTISLIAFPYKGETLPLVTLKDFSVTAARTFKNDRDRLAYFKLKRDVRKAYPYAVLASVKLKEYDAILTNIPESQRAPYLKKTEAELKTQFESDLKNLTMSQGRILIRLINRETGMTTYKVIRDYRGGFSAFMWQSLGLLWGNNLRWTYDPSKGEDKVIEEIIQQIQDGEV